MKEQLAALWGKVVENKEVLIRVGAAVTGAALGLAIVAVVANAQSEENLLVEEVEMSIEDDEDSENEEE